MTSLRALSACSRGAAAAEMALLVPLLVVLLFGSIEVGHYFYNEHLVIKGVRDGARYASRQSFTNINCQSGSSVPTGIETDIKEVTRTGSISGGTPRVSTWTSNTQVTVTKSCGGSNYTRSIYSNEPAAPIITIAASVPYQSLFSGVGVITNSYQLSASQQSAVMGI